VGAAEKRSMAKEVTAKVKFHITGGQATPAPPVGPALSQHGVNIGDFVRRFNDATKDRMGVVIPVVVTVYGDRTFEFITKSPPASFLLKQAAGIAKGSGVPNRDKVAEVSMDVIREIAEKKAQDLNARNPDEAMRIILGTARSMGIEVTGS
jgi:large subunit ribosomal protein L11